MPEAPRPLVKPALSFAGAALITAIAISLFFGGLSSGLLQEMCLTAPISAALSTLLIWRRKQGAWAGVAIAILAYPLMFHLIFLASYCIYERSRDQEFGRVVEAIWGYTGVGFALTCWLTIPAGAIMGWWLARSRSAIRVTIPVPR